MRMPQRKKTKQKRVDNSFVALCRVYIEVATSDPTSGYFVLPVAFPAACHVIYRQLATNKK